MRTNIGVPKEIYEALVGLQADAMKHLKRQVSLPQVIAALVEYAKMPHEGHGGTHHLVWTDRMGDEGP